MKKTIHFLFFILIFSLVYTTVYSQTPDWQWAKKAGSTGLDGGQSIALTKRGWMYVTGRYTGTIVFNKQIGTFSLTNAGSTDVFFALIDDLGYTRMAKKGGGSGVDQGRSIVVDAVGNAYIAGIFNSTATFSPRSVSSAGYNDIFIVKYDTLGNVRWLKKIGGTGFENNPSLAIKNGNLFVTGNFQGTCNFDTIALTSAGSDDIFIARMDTAGNFNWAKKAGGTSSDLASGIAIDNNSNVYIGGRFSNIATFGTNQLISAGNFDGFYAKYDISGNNIWANRFGSKGFESVYAITADGPGNFYITGNFDDTMALGSTTLMTAGGTDVFTAKFTTAGVPVWSRRAGGTSSESGIALALETTGNVVVTGTFRDKIGFGTDSLTSTGGEDIFIVKYNSSGNKQWQKRTGDIGNESAPGIAIDFKNNIYLTGSFQRAVDFGSTNLASASNSDDFFIGRISLNSLPVAIPKTIPLSDPVSVYPNPTRGNITFNNSTRLSGEFVIYNMLGSVMKRVKVTDEQTQNFVFSDLSNGLYIVVFNYGTSSISFKLLKE